MSIYKSIMSPYLDSAAERTRHAQPLNTSTRNQTVTTRGRSWANHSETSLTFDHAIALPPATATAASQFMDEMEKSTNFNAGELERLKRRFMKLDADGSGSIDREEFLQISQIASNPLASRMIAIFDEDGGGTVDFQEFVGGLSAFSSRGGREEKLRCDRIQGLRYGPRWVYLQWRALLGAKNDGWKQLEVDKTIMEADKDGDGKLSFEEFTAMVAKTRIYSDLFGSEKLPCIVCPVIFSLFPVDSLALAVKTPRTSQIEGSNIPPRAPAAIHMLSSCGFPSREIPYGRRPYLPAATMERAYMLILAQVPSLRDTSGYRVIGVMTGKPEFLTRTLVFITGQEGANLEHARLANCKLLRSSLAPVALGVRLTLVAGDGQCTQCSSQSTRQAAKSRHTQC
ncbi:calcium/calmodulin-dependent protein phosphatase [Rhizoctonia solani AG-1 IA]|uniref:Calcineurin subunit B n=1 Tax=Thanatephorus cucumeris (strain AG1-IA) TaxID=983506 RepID=L8X675_THACA|nr:calcium/calmodulin-dependent protein phosphatase [Rhizoctonia solani AG-1 IA]